MKKITLNSLIIALLTLSVIIILVLNLIFDTYPILALIKYMESRRFYWTIPVTGAVIYGIWLFSQRIKRKLETERTAIFNATIRTIQDILQNSTSSMQLLIMDMYDERVPLGIIHKAEANINELNRVIRALSAIDPSSLELKELNKNLSVIKMEETTPKP